MDWRRTPIYQIKTKLSPTLCTCPLIKFDHIERCQKIDPSKF